jgi:carboxymethylenebutenolidase
VQKEDTDAHVLAKSFVPDGHVFYLPSSKLAAGSRDLRRFYQLYFGHPPSLVSKLISRTVGSDRVVDEIVVSFTHDREVKWILPGVEPTNKKVRPIDAGKFSPGF